MMTIWAKQISGVLFFMLLATVLSAQSNSQALNTLNKISDEFSEKIKSVSFNVDTKYHYRCGDSILQEYHLEYSIKNGQYYIKGGEMDFVMTSSFYLVINHSEKYMVYSNVPSLEYQKITDNDALAQARLNLANNAKVEFDTLGKDLYVMRVQFPEGMANNYSAFEIEYNSAYQLRAIRYAETPLQERMYFGAPNCVEITYSNEKIRKFNRSPFQRDSYLYEKNGEWKPKSAFAEYQIIEQIKPNE